MILSSVPESVGGVKTSFRRNIRPLVETKMPLAYQMSGIPCKSEIIKKKTQIDNQLILFISLNWREGVVR